MSLTLKQARNVLGKQNEYYTDKELQNLLYEFYTLAQVIAATVASRGSNQTPKVIDPQIAKEENGK